MPILKQGLTNPLGERVPEIELDDAGLDRAVDILRPILFE